MKAYGDYQLDMMSAMKNGKILEWSPYKEDNKMQLEKEVSKSTCDKKRLEFLSTFDDDRSWWLEYNLIFIRFLQQMWRDKVNDCKSERLN